MHLVRPVRPQQGMSILPENELSAVLGGELELSYSRGWNEQQDLADQMHDSLQRDRKYGHTLLGPHRADLGFTIQGKPCAEHLSRGQIKTLVCAMKIIQARILEQERQQGSIFLADDLTAELDSGNLGRVLAMLSGNPGAQVFITAIEPPKMLQSATLPQANQTKLFHVKHGKIERC